MRDQLIADVDELNSAEEAANWAHRVLGAKNSLTAADTECVEQAFREQLASMGATPSAEDMKKQTGQRQVKKPGTASIDKTVLALSTQRRIRDRDHVKSVAKHPCLVCGRHPSDAHHLRLAQSPALGRKVSDEFTVPLCRGHHREVHRCGDETAWWNKIGIDPSAVARVLWLNTHPLPSGVPRFKLRNEANLESGAPLTSYRQIEANRRNALKSTGPRTEAGKEISRRNAVRHGLTAETIITALEDAEDYRAFEAAITADYDAQSTVERELVLRLASIRWRLRRATTMETGLFEIQA